MSKNRSKESQEIKDGCHNCKYIMWLIAIGGGLKCKVLQPDGEIFDIPGRFHKCDKFDKK